MQKKFFLYVGISITAVVFLSLFLTNNTEQITAQTFPELEFTYSEANLKLKQSLVSNGIFLSSPIELSSPEHIEEFCTFFEDTTLQTQAEHCISTELHDSDGKFLGNIHMVESKKMPKIILVLIQTDPFMKNIEEIKYTYSKVIENLVCNCWEDIKPGDIPTVSHWVDKLKNFHTSDIKPNSISKLNIAEMQLQMELTTNTEGYLWKLIISG